MAADLVAGTHLAAAADSCNTAARLVADIHRRQVVRDPMAAVVAVLVGNKFAAGRIDDVVAEEAEVAASPAVAVVEHTHKLFVEERAAVACPVVVVVAGGDQVADAER